MRRCVSLLGLVLSFALLGCPPDAPDTKSPASGGAKTGSDDVGEGSGGQTGGQAGGETGGGEGPRATPWTVIPQEDLEAMAEEGREWPMLEPVTRWPAPAGLRAISEVPEAQRPDETAQRLLADMTRLLISEEFHPRDFTAALGVDAQGRTFLRLGNNRTEGTATLESHGDGFKPVFSVVFDHPGQKTLESVRDRVNRVVVRELAASLSRDAHALQSHPNVPNAALSNLRNDPNGFGVQFPWVWVYGGEDKILLVFMEEPHMSLDPNASPTPGGD